LGPFLEPELRTGNAPVRPPPSICNRDEPG
jgi:hypothetical protein